MLFACDEDRLCLIQVISVTTQTQIICIPVHETQGKPVVGSLKSEVEDFELQVSRSWAETPILLLNLHVKYLKMFSEVTFELDFIFQQRSMKLCYSERYSAEV